MISSTVETFSPELLLLLLLLLWTPLALALFFRLILSDLDNFFSFISLHCKCFKTKCCAPAKRCSAVPGGPWRRDMVCQNEITILTVVQHLNVQRCSFTHYSPIVTPRTLPSAGRSTKRNTHHNRGDVDNADNPQPSTRSKQLPCSLLSLSSRFVTS